MGYTVQARSAVQVSALGKAQQSRPPATASPPPLKSENLSISRPLKPTPPEVSRRLTLGLIPASIQLASSLSFASLTAPQSAHAAESLFNCLTAAPTSLSQPFYNGPFDSKTIYYPRWMFGEWNVHSKFVGLNIPKGPKFVPEGFLQAADAPAESGGIGSEYDYSLRFYSTLPDTFENNAKFMLGLGGIEDAIIADKAYNTKNMTDAFLGYPGAVEAVDYDPTDSPMRQTVMLSRLGPDMAPLPPRRLELYINGLKSEIGEDGKSFVTSELSRQVMLGIRAAQVTDYEVVNEYELVKPGVIKGKQRSLLYLQPQDPLYFQVFGKAVAVYDYEFTMTRVAVPEDAPRGAIACVMTPKQVDQCL